MRAIAATRRAAARWRPIPRPRDSGTSGRCRLTIDEMNFSGVFAPIPTPFDERDRVDTGRLSAALRRWTARPITGFIVLGSNGGASLMDDFEADQVVVFARGIVRVGA